MEKAEDLIAEKDLRIKKLEQQLTEIKANVTKERECTISVISQIARVFWGYDSEFNNQVREAIAKIDTTKTIFNQVDGILELQSVLHVQSKKMNLFHGSVAAYLKEIPKFIAQCNVLPAPLREEALFILDPKNSLSTTEKILNILELTGKALARFKEGSEIKGDNLLPQQYKNELFSVITGVELPDELNAQLNSCRDNLQKPITFADTPNICKNIITTIIKSTNKERDNTTFFLSSLYDHISVIQNSLNDSLENNASITKANKENNVLFNTELSDIGNCVNKNNLSEISQLLKEKIDNLYSLVNERDKFINLQDKLLTDLGDIESKISIIKQEASDFRDNVREISTRNKIDSLTGLNNRYSFDHRFEEDMSQFNPDEDPSIVVMIADIDDFNIINEKYNTAVGDKILRVLGVTIRRNIRETDFVARLGSDHFGIILYGVNAETAKQPAYKLISAIKAIPFHYKNEKVDVSISVIGTTIESKISSADIITKIENKLTELKTTKQLNHSQLHIFNSNGNEQK